MIFLHETSWHFGNIPLSYIDVYASSLAGSLHLFLYKLPRVQWGSLFFQVASPATPPAPTHHATVIVPAPAQPHHVTVVTMGPTSVINTVSTSRQNLDTIVQVRPTITKNVLHTRGCCWCSHHLPPSISLQAIQHIEGTQGKGCVGEEEQRRAVIVSSGRVPSDAAASDTASNSDGPDDCSLPWIHLSVFTCCTLTYTKRICPDRPWSCETHSNLPEWTLTGLLDKFKHSPLVFLTAF